LKIKEAATPEPVEIESVKVTVLANESYIPPQAVITANGKEIKDALKEPVLISKGQKVTLDAVNSKGKIKSYKWDLGDGSALVTSAKVEHTFEFSAPFSYSFFPILQVEDENGLISETLVQITNKEALETSDQQSQEKKTSFPLLWIGLGGLAVGLIVGGILFLRAKKGS
jgi:hypothetical protein